MLLCCFCLFCFCLGGGGGGGDLRYFLIPFEIRIFFHSKNRPDITTLVDWKHQLTYLLTYSLSACCCVGYQLIVCENMQGKVSVIGNLKG